MKQPPHLKGNRFTGNFKQFKTNPIELLLHASEELGDIFMLKSVNKPIYFVNNPEYIEHVTKTNYTNYIKTPSTPLKKIFGNSIFTSDGEQWLQKRQMYQPELNQTAIKSYFDSVNESVESMINKIDQAIKTSDLVNITQLMTEVTISILGDTLFGLKLGLNSHINKDISTIIEWIGDRRLRHPFVTPLSIKTKTNKRFLNAVDRMDHFIYDIINKKKTAISHSNDLISRFIENEKSNSAQVNSKALRDEAMTIFLAGHETSANVLNWTLYLLATHPNIQDKVYNEIKSLNNNVIGYEDLRSLPYLVQVLNESMRLYPPIWHFGRVAKQDDYIEDFFIPAGTAVRVSPLTIQQNTRYWDNPKQFDPERFKDNSNIKPFTFIPFGAGPRLCAGRNFAMMEMILIISKISQCFKLSYSRDPVEIEPLTTLRSKGDIFLNIEIRSN